MVKKIIIIVLLFSLLFWQNGNAVLLYADTLTPTPTDTQVTPTPDQSVVTPTPTIDSAAVTPTPTDTTTPTPTIDSLTVTPTPTQTTDATVQNNANVSNAISSSGNSGNNTVDASSSAEATPSALPSDVLLPSTPPSTNGGNGGDGNTNTNASVTTGNSLAVTTGGTDENVNNINSQVVMQTINIFATQNAPIDLSAPGNIASQILLGDKNNDPVINVQALSNNNYTYLNNTVVNAANSGDNSATSSGSFVINTGNAYSIVSLVNKVNFTIVDSVVHVVVINIFGTLNGNIILPTLPNTSSCAGCGISANISNDATVSNTVNSQAISGQNNITLDSSGSATITTGNAKSVVNVDNLVNTNVLGVPFEHLLINNFGLWNGNFAGWDAFVATTGGRSLFFNALYPSNPNGSCPNCFGSVAITNQATVQNNITSFANTGGNAVDGNNGTIHTGNAYSAVSLINFVNTNLIRTFGFFGFINIFGAWNGDLGDANTLTPTPTPTPATTSSSSSGSSVCTGNTGLAVDLSSNVGAFVYPGDSILFFTKLKNTGTADLHDISILLTLSEGGKIMGGAQIKLNKTLSVGAGEKIIANLGLTPAAPGGTYTAHVEVVGHGCGSDSVTTTSDTSFLVAGGVSANIVPQAQAFTEKGVLHAATGPAVISACANCLWWQLLAIEVVLLFGYAFFVKRRKVIKGKSAVLLSIPVMTYILFLLINKHCISFDRFGLINAASFFCKYFWVWDLIIWAIYLTLNSNMFKSKAKRLGKNFSKFLFSK